MGWNVLITARVFTDVGAPALELLRNAGCTLTIPSELGPYRADELQPKLAGMDAVLASPDSFTPEVLRSPEAATLKLISRWGVGYDSVHLKSATELGIPVAFTPGFLNEAVADYTWALLLGVARHIHSGHGAMMQGKWLNHWGHDVGGKTIGIVGYGRIGQAVAKRARGFDMKVLAFDLRPPAGVKEVSFVPLEELMAQSDFVCLHAALNADSRGMISEAQLRRMKPSAYLINTARGPLIDDVALARGLREGWLAGAALDVFATEPLPDDHVFRDTPNILLSPHQSSFARDTGERVSIVSAQAIIDWMQGKTPTYLVNPEVMNLPQLRK